MKLIGLMCVKNEAWILGLSARVALKWCDELVMVDHSSTDDTLTIINQLEREYPWRIQYSRWDDRGEWDEMEMREHSLLLGRKFRGTHFAVVDADEILTGNLMSSVKSWANGLGPGDMIDLPMIPAWRSLSKFRDDDSVWSRGVVSMLFRDDPSLTWQPQADGYEHHNRPPAGIKTRIRPLQDKKHGGVIHAQWADWTRVLQKHVHYRMMEQVRWPGRMSPADLNAKYDQALNETGVSLSDMPPPWLEPHRKLIDLHYRPKGDSWYRWEIKKLLAAHGPAAFEGLDLKGYAV